MVIWVSQYLQVLSGYVIAKVIGDSRITAGYLGRFAARRALRLDPPYWASIATVIALSLIAMRMGVAKIGFAGWRGCPATPFSLLQDLVGVKAISSVYWTLCLELQFYVVLILLLATRWPVIALCALGAWSLLEHADITDLAPRGIFVPYWFAFAAGGVDLLECRRETRNQPTY